MEGGYRRKMVGSSAAEAAVTKATNKRKREKTRAEMDKHNLRCVEHRNKKRMRFKELEKMETEHNQTLDENQRMNRELEEMKSKIQCMENENRILRRALEEQAATEAWMRQIPTGWNINGQNFSSLDESVAWFALQEYEQVSQGVLINPGSGSSFGANHDFPNEFDAPNNHGVLINPGSGSSFGANHDFPNEFDAPNNHDNIGMLTHNSAAGFLSNSGASFSFGANADLPSGFDTPNNHDNNGSPF